MKLHIPPKPFDAARAARVKEALAEKGFVSGEPLLDAVFGNSAFLGRLAVRETGALAEYFAAGPQTALNAAILLALACAHAKSEAQAMKDLRTAKRRPALVISTKQHIPPRAIKARHDSAIRFALAACHG